MTNEEVGLQKMMLKLPSNPVTIHLFDWSDSVIHSIVAFHRTITIDYWFYPTFKFCLHGPCLYLKSSSIVRKDHHYLCWPYHHPFQLHAEVWLISKKPLYIFRLFQVWVPSLNPSNTYMYIIIPFTSLRIQKSFSRNLSLEDCT